MPSKPLEDLLEKRPHVRTADKVKYLKDIACLCSLRALQVKKARWGWKGIPEGDLGLDREHGGISSWVSRRGQAERYHVLEPPGCCTPRAALLPFFSTGPTQSLHM